MNVKNNMGIILQFEYIEIYFIYAQLLPQSNLTSSLQMEYENYWLLKLLLKLLIV